MSALGGFARRQVANLAWAGRAVGRRGALPTDRAVWLDVRVPSPLHEIGTGVDLFGTGEAPLGLLELLRTLDAVADDPRVAGVLLRFEGGLGSFSDAAALRRGVERVRARRKPVVAWGAALDSEDFLVASACDRVWLPVSGALDLVGLRSEYLYLRGALDKWDVEPEVVHIGRFKNAGEMLTRDRMSETQREQIAAWQADVFDELVSGIATGRGVEAEAVREWIDQGPYPAKRAAEVGLIDECLYPDEIDPRLLELSRSESSGDVAHLRCSDYYGLHAGSGPPQPLLRELPQIAYVVATGNIQRGYGRRGIASERLGGLLDRLRRHDPVAGVVLRIDSPGGDAVASDLLYRKVRELAGEKPVVASMGGIAASGGYYIAAAAHAIFAERATVTGSIGVVGGKVNLAGLYERLGIGKEAVEQGARAGLHSDTRGFSDAERSAVVESMEAVYDLFLDRVAEGRGLDREAVRAVAEGRVWSGGEAAAHRLVDALGGPLEALADVRRRAGLAPHEPWNLSLHPRRSPWLGLRELIRVLTELG